MTLSWLESNHCQDAALCDSSHVVTAHMALCSIRSSYVPQPRTLLHAVDARIKQV